MAVPHPQEIENRIAYAQRVLGFLDTHIPQAKAANLALFSEGQWAHIANLAGENVPSLATISCIIALVRGRELAVEAIRGGLSDPSKRLLSHPLLEDS